MCHIQLTDSFSRVHLRKETSHTSHRQITHVAVSRGTRGVSDNDWIFHNFINTGPVVVGDFVFFMISEVS